ncbi:hypothetical protein SC020_05740 [Legionella pneumophila serogroup 1]|uniref:hypothetical protein n=1 Tax=Legionella pneumophila TaxID=446 RepID=UPI0012B69D9A|nr:hypothetical protein [Legionella pneumophila]
MSPRLPKVIYQIFNLQLLRRYAPRNDGPKNRTVQRIIKEVFHHKDNIFYFCMGINCIALFEF